MSTNKVFDEVFENDFSEKAVAFKNNVKNAINNYVSNPSNPAYVRFLNQQYWDMVYFIAKRKILSEVSVSELEFSAGEKILIDFGYISDKIIENSEKMDINALEEALGASNPDAPVQYFSITEWLVEQFKEYTGIRTIERLGKQYETLLQNIEKERIEKEKFVELKKTALQKIVEIFNENHEDDKLKKVIDLSIKISDNIDRYGSMRSMINSEIPIRPEERVEYVNIEKNITSCREERKKIFKSLPSEYHEQFSELILLEDSIIQKENDMFDIIIMIGKSKNALENFIFSKKEILNDEKNMFLKDKISALKNIIEVISKCNKTEPLLFLTRPVPRNIPDIVFQIIQKTIKFDVNIFNNKKVRSYGTPCIVFVPGRGRGDFDYNINAFIFPQFPLKDYTELVLNAMALYRWECDDDGKLKNSFGNLKSNKYFSSGPALKQAFIKNYSTYMTKEVDGYKSLDFDKDMRDWFSVQISAMTEEKMREQSRPAAAYNKIEKAPGTEQAVQPAPAAKSTDAAAAKTDKTDDTAMPQPERPEEPKPGERVVTVRKIDATIKKQIKLPGEFHPESDENSEEPESKQIQERPDDIKKEEVRTDGDAPSKSQPAAKTGLFSKLRLKLPGETSGDERGRGTSRNHEKAQETDDIKKESTAAPGIDENDFTMLSENCKIITDKIRAIFKIESDGQIIIKPSKLPKKVNIQLNEVDVNSVKFFLNLMSAQSKFYKFMVNILKDENL